MQKINAFKHHVGKFNLQKAAVEVKQVTHINIAFFAGLSPHARKDARPPTPNRAGRRNPARAQRYDTGKLRYPRQGLPRVQQGDSGEPAWRPPNTKLGGLQEARRWDKRKPEHRQAILNPDLLEVDDSGELDIEHCSLERNVMRERGWGQIFNGSYGKLLFELQSHLEMTFRIDGLGQRQIRNHWKEVMEAMQVAPQERWGVPNVDPVAPNSRPNSHYRTA